MGCAPAFPDDTGAEAKSRSRAQEKGLRGRGSEDPKGSGAQMRASYFSKDVEEFL